MQCMAAEGVLGIKTSSARQGYISFYGHIFYQTLDMTTLVHFICYAHVVDVPTHPVPL